MTSKTEETTSADAIAACPHCGGPGKMAQMPGAARWWRVRCEDFHCGATTWAMDEQGKALSAWNRRHECGAL